ncbi:uncharacterized protein At4g22758 [Diospyros lotus]|uniref:uncharacterized protein At4g22758 n=1 Tax=Diospyros lotus TaxID=55363 RepID=UPI00224E7E0A|nr:uncharacterized protein At4g22758 [Diospyros lotus]
MPNWKGSRRGQEEKNRKGKLAERASSFHGKKSGTMGELLARPRTVPDLLAGGSSNGSAATEGRAPLKLTKLLLNVTVQRSLGPVQVVMSPESTVSELIAAALQQYVKEGRRPILPSAQPSGFDLHYSQFSLESLDREEKLISLGSRNFFLCPKISPPATESGGATSSSCSNQAEKATKIVIPWLKFSF